MNPRKPNILFLFVDDLRPELGCYGCQHVISPNIDRLASMGCLFDKAYVQVALCNPSRASMLTGKRPDELSVWGLDVHFRHTVPDVITLPQHFMAHGYHTATIGKIYHNTLPDPASWSEPQIMIDGYPYDPDAVYRDDGNIHYLEQRKQQIIKEGNQDRYIDELGQWYLKACATELPDVPDDAYRSRSLRTNDKPFFFGLGYYRPHLPFNVPKRYLSAGATTIPR